MYELREKTLRDEISAMAGAKAEGKVEAWQDSICKYLEVRFGTAVLDLQQQVRNIASLDELNRIINSIYTAGTIEEAQAIILGTRN